MTLGLDSLPYLRSYVSRRESSYDRTGGNRDFVTVGPGERHTLLLTDKPGCVRHIWMTLGSEERWFPRRSVLRASWDGQESPSVESPVGDFFGMGFGLLKNFVSAPLQMSPEDGRGMNCWWPMPYHQAHLEFENQGEKPLSLYYYVDYEEYSAPHAENVARFHAMWRREHVTEGWLTERLNNDNVWDIWAQRPNLSDQNNYLIMEATGSGIYCGCNLSIDCFQRQGNDWYGEGDDMIVIDGEPWPPRLHGTGTEDYFNTAFGPRQEYCAPYHGITLYSGTKDWPYKGKNAMYRYHILDPIRFEKSIRVSIEHGHSNKLSNDYSSTAYWYQTLPSAPLPALLPMEARLPRLDEPEFP